jgi:cytochrome c553
MASRQLAPATARLLALTSPVGLEWAIRIEVPLCWLIVGACQGNVTNPGWFRGRWRFFAPSREHSRHRLVSSARGHRDEAGAMRARGGVAAMVALLVSMGAADADERAGQGEQKAAQCVACHGIRGLAPNPTFPHLAGQNAAYLGIQLRYFRAGERYHPLMTPIAETLSDRDIDELAAYYSELQPQSEAP